MKDLHLIIISQLYILRCLTYMSAQAKAELLVRGKELMAAFNRLDFEAAAGMYTEEATVLPEGAMAVKGRAGMCTTVSKVMHNLQSLMYISSSYYFIHIILYSLYK